MFFLHAQLSSRLAGRVFPRVVCTGVGACVRGAGRGDAGCTISWVCGARRRDVRCAVRLVR
jgi:hypothetical protein